jgi:hypothetical protein
LYNPQSLNQNANNNYFLNNSNSFYNFNNNNLENNSNINTYQTNQQTTYFANLSINKTNFNLNDSWILTLNSNYPNQPVYICAIDNKNNKSCTPTQNLGFSPHTDANGNWSASGNWIKNGQLDESLLGTWTEWMYVGGNFVDGEVIGGVRSNEITFTINKSNSGIGGVPIINNNINAIDKLGVYIWGYLPPQNNSLDNLVNAGQKAKNIGFKIARTTISPCYWDPSGQIENPLSKTYDLLKRNDYASIFNNFNVVMVTLYPLSICDLSTGQPYYRENIDFSRWNEILKSAHQEIKQTVLQAKILYPNTTFIWSNWELENDCQDNEWSRCVDYQKTRLQAILDAKNEVIPRNLSGGGGIYSAIEFVYLDKNWVPGWLDEWGPPPAPRQNSGLLTAATDLKGLWDFISYSSWGSIHYTEDPAWRPKQKFAEAFEKIRNTCRDNGFDCSNKIIIGEVGTLYDSDTDHSLLNEAIQKSIEEGAQYVFYWNLYDQPDSKFIAPNGVVYDQSKFGAYSINDEITPRGKYLENILK